MLHFTVTLFGLINIRLKHEGIKVCYLVKENVRLLWISEEELVVSCDFKVVQPHIFRVSKRLSVKFERRNLAKVPQRQI